MNALLRWETSITDMPLDFQSVISAWAWFRTSSGSVAGPAAKLNTRIVLSSGNRPSCRTRNVPGRYCPGRELYQDSEMAAGHRSRFDGSSAAGWIDRIRAGIPGTEFRRARARAWTLLGQAVDALDARQALALTQSDETH